MAKCPLCERTFSMTLWKHECTVCRRTVCDDCAPKNSGDNKGGSARICAGCKSSGRRLGNALGGAEQPSSLLSSSPAAPQASLPSGQARPDPNSEEERARRLAAIEARRQPQAARGRPAPAAAKTSPTPSPAGSGSASPAPPVTQATTGDAALAPSSPPPPPAAPAGSNPVLEAALRRQQQQQQQQGTRPGPQMSEEKSRLLRQIDALLEQHKDTPPFGIRSADEAKLKSYLAYLKQKYGVS